MSFSPIGDLANSLLLSQASINAKRNLARLSQELTTGVTTDVRGKLRNDLSQQSDWQNGISKNKVLDNTLSEALTKIKAKQSALEAISETSVALANNISVALSANASEALAALSHESQNGFEQTLAQLNTRVLQQNLFSGQAQHANTMASADEILASVKSFVGVASSATDLAQSVQTWMNDPANGYNAIAYLGSEVANSPIRLSNDRLITEESSANSKPIKSMIENLILASLSKDDDVLASKAQRVELLKTASDGLRTAESQMTVLRAEIGFVEAELSKEKVMVGASTATYERLRAEILGIDEYGTASKLQATELQIEKIYAMTARSARMSLLEYIR